MQLEIFFPSRLISVTSFLPSADHLLPVAQAAVNNEIHWTSTPIVVLYDFDEGEMMRNKAKCVAHEKCACYMN
jgi:hypothetical protein